MSSISIQLPERRGTVASGFARPAIDGIKRVSLKRLSQSTYRLFAAVSWTWIAAISYLVVVASVAAYDVLLTIRYANFLAQMEENPIGRWLMNLKVSATYDLEAAPNIVPFLVLKIIGTCIVLVTIASLIRWRAHMGHLVGMGVSLFQLGLAAYLTYR